MNMAKFGLHKNVVLCTAGYAKKQKGKRKQNFHD